MADVRVGIGVMILDKDDKILLGHRLAKYTDTGGIHEGDTWTLPGGKQEFGETFYQGAVREVKEETNLDIKDLILYGVSDDIAPDRHYITLQVIAKRHYGKLNVMENDKIDEWRWFDFEELPENLYTPSKKFIEDYNQKVHREKVLRKQALDLAMQLEMLKRSINDATKLKENSEYLKIIAAKKSILNEIARIEYAKKMGEERGLKK